MRKKIKKVGGHFIGKISVRAFIQNLQTKDYLVVRAPGQNKYEIPGGRLDNGENIEQGLVREVAEELGINLGSIKPEYVYSEVLLHGKDKSLQTLMVFKIIVSNNLLKKLILNEEIKEFKWINRKNYKNLKYFGDCIRSLNYYFN